MTILVLNCGSSSIKFSVIDTVDEHEVLGGLAEGIGEDSGRLRYHHLADEQAEPQARELVLADHGQALELILESVHSVSADVMAIGHRVVHGGRDFLSPTAVDDQVLVSLAMLDHLAPLHNPVNRLGIERAMALFPDLPQVAVFDTAFHATLPEVAYRYAVPEEWYQQYGVRRYGFHGISHQYVSAEAARFLGRPADELNLVTLHLGNGSSATAVAGGRSVDTSMGMTPLAGLVMGTRSGDIDPGALLYLQRQGLGVAGIDERLNHDSGLKGLCGDNDMRAIAELAETGDRTARLAREMYCYRVRQYVGAYCAALGRLDAIVFTAGIGENDAWVRERVTRDMATLGISLDEDANALRSDEARAVSSPDSRVAVLVVPTREELQIAREVRAILDQ